MAKLKYTNAMGQRLIFGESAPFLITKIDGLSAPQNIIQRQKAPYQDGTTYIDSKLEERQIVMEGVILKADIQQRRRDLIKIFNPKLSGILELIDMNMSIRCYPELAPVFPSNMQNKMYQPFMITLLCPDPYWYDDTEERWELKSFSGGFGFSLSFPLSFGTVGTKLVVENNGDVETPIILELYGPMSKPVLSNETTGESISITQDILSGERLEIITTYGEKSVDKIALDGTRSKAFHYISPTSKFFNLRVGKNILSYTATDTTSESNAIVYYRNRYLGV